ncbi:MAG: hypothetical protein WC444_05500 [Candidatus Paceibacterota bacterium]
MATMRTTSLATEKIYEARRGKNINFKNNVEFEGTVLIEGNFTIGDASADTLTLTGLTTVSDDQKIQFRDTGLYIYSSANGQLDIVADTTLKATSPTVELEASTGITLDGDVTIDGAHTLTTGTGAISVLGDATFGTTKKAYFRDTGLYIYSSADGQLDIVGDTTVKTTAPTIELEGSTAVTLDGDTTIDGAHTFATGTGDVSINGDALLATTKKVQFRDTGIYINSGADGKLTISSDGSGADDITLSGTVTLDANLTTPSRIICSTVGTAYTAPALSVGVHGTPLVDAVAADMIAFSVNITTATNKGSAESSMAAYFGAANSTDTANTRLQSVLASTTVAGNCFDAYGVQGHLTISGAATATSNGNMCGGSFKVSVGAAVNATLQGLLVTVDGDNGNTITGTSSMIYLDSVHTVTNGILFGQCGNLTSAFYFSAASGPIGAAVTACGGSDASIKVNVEGSAYYIPLYDSLSA